MSVSIKVAVRVRPFTKEQAELGVLMRQNGDEDGEVNLLRSKYTESRFAFSWSWWSAYGWQRHCSSDPAEVEQMAMTNQEDAYNAVGVKIKNDVLGGNAVVMFAYGLSGSGKTFTTFGPDAPDIPEAWFKHAEPHPLWGIFPHLAYDLFQMKADGWKISMKYFQNVVDTVRDLMSPVAEEQHYKSGMRKDADGFMDIQWCRSVVLTSWDDLRQQFQRANQRKAIAPTQFNHQSTRGHCVMTLEVEMPMEDNPAMKQRGRIYVCDLAGTEPAGDIVYATYQKKVYDDGTIEHKYLGPHQDQRKTKELQDQGKKINLSLSEMAQFFMKMAEAIKKKRLKPGMTIPGCNSYFLSKYLKDTMLQARTYLFCAIRPEVDFHNYTFATLGFAKNASVIKLQPKKATIAATPAERKLMAELDQMKLLVDQLKEQNEALQKSGGGGGGENPEMQRLQEMLEQKQKQLADTLAGGDSGTEEDTAQLEQQKEEYGRRGISLTYYEKDTQEPYFINVDEDPFRSNRFMYLLDSPSITFGPGGHIQPPALTVVRNHCTVERSDDGSTVTLVGGKGETFHNGRRIPEGERIELTPYDRVVMGSELLLFHHAARDPEDSEPPSAEECIDEYQAGLVSSQQSGGGGSSQELDEQMAKFMEEKAQWEQERAKDQEQQDAEVAARAMQAVDREISELLPKTKEAKSLVDILNRSQLSFDVSLQRAKDSHAAPTVKVLVNNNATSESIFLDTFEFIKGFSLLKDEQIKLKNAIENDREYELPEHHDPLFLLFDNTFHLGTATSFPEFAIFFFPTDDEETKQEIKKAAVPYNTIGLIEVIWEPLAGVPADDDGEDGAAERKEADELALPDITEPEELLGKPWTYRIRIKQATGLPVRTDMAYCQYEFFGETFTTETVEQDTLNPTWEYEFVHHIENVTQDFIDFLQQPFDINIFVSPYVDPPRDKISTTNEHVRANVLAGHAVSSSSGGAAAAGAGAAAAGAGGDELNAYRAKVLELSDEVERLKKENSELRSRVEMLEGELAESRSGEPRDRPISKSRLADALDTDQKVNPPAEGEGGEG